MYSINDLRTGTIIQHNHEPYVVTWTQHVKMGRGGAILRTKIKNLVNGSLLEKTFKGNDKIEEADLERGRANFLYKDDAAAYLMDNNSFDQYSLPLDQLGKKIYFLKEGEDVEVLYFNKKAVNLDLPIKVVLKVTEAPPGIKGDTAQGATKQVALETGLVINVPLFIKEGDYIRINTTTGEYVEKAK
jgi:elongation factor P